MKKLIRVLASVMAVAMGCFGFIGCGQNNNSADTLNMTIVNLGFGVDWLYDLADAYQQKNPDFKYEITVLPGSNGNDTINGQSEALTGDTDIFMFRPSSYHYNCYQGAVSTASGNYDCLYVDLTDIYNEPYEGENGATMLSKMDTRVSDYLKVNGKYYGVNWVDDFMGFVRNKDAWAKLGLTDDDIPMTTNQMISLFDNIKKTSNSISPMIYSRNEEYYTSIWQTWFGQYEGSENFNKFIQGRDKNGEISEGIYGYEGQRVALEFVSKLISKEGGKYVYQHKDSDSLDFTDMQSYFLLGQAALCVNGSWLEIEMNKDNETAKNYNIDFIPTPVISDLVENLSFYGYDDNNWKNFNTLSAEEQKTYDDKLAQLIAFVDEHPNVGDNTGAPSFATAADVEKVRDARHTSYHRGGNDHTAVIPCWSSKIDMAKKFLKYIYSDEGMKVYYNSQGGMQLPAKLSNGTYDNITLSGFAQSVTDIMSEGYYDNWCFADASKVYCLGGVNPCFYNGTDNFVKEMLNGKSVDYILQANRTYIINNITSIKRNSK